MGLELKKKNSVIKRGSSIALDQALKSKIGFISIPSALFSTAAFF